MNKYKITFRIYVKTSESVPAVMTSIIGVYEFTGYYASYNNAELAGELKGNNMISNFINNNQIPLNILKTYVAKIEKIKGKRKVRYIKGGNTKRYSNYQLTLPSKYRG